MTLRYLTDEDITDVVAIGLRSRGVDAISVHEIGRSNQGIPDDEQLLYATEQGRVIVTYNRDDFQIIDARWREEERQHAGILWCMEAIILRRAIGELIRALIAMSEQFDTLEGLCLPLQRAR
jgi:predicted nuclease of predicted toxin-antitoxin system